MGDGGPQDDEMDKALPPTRERICTMEPDPKKHAGAHDAGSEGEPSDDSDEADVDDELVQKSMRRAAKAQNDKTCFVWRDGKWVEVPNVLYKQRALTE